MPTITVSFSDLAGLIGEEFTREDLEDSVALVKGEIKDVAGDEIRIELADTNRPDLWCPEGIARQIRTYHAGRPPVYPFFDRMSETTLEIQADPALATIRPHVGGFVARGPKVSDAFLKSLIQTQEKLSENMGRRRAGLSMGIYRADLLRFPVRYRAVGRAERKFVPLGFEREMTPSQILTEHPKGIQYAGLLAGSGPVPILEDADGRILSLAPIINSRETGQVQAGDTALFIEMTATDLRMLLLGLNIAAANLADRGYRITSVATRYAAKTEFGTRVVSPHPLTDCGVREGEVSVALIERMLGVQLETRAVVDRLRAYGLEAIPVGRKIQCRIPAYRADLMHPVDLVEDYLLSRGVSSFEPVMPEEFTVGRLSPLTEFCDLARRLWAGLGYEEILSNVLASRKDLTERLRSPDADPVELANPFSASFNVLRPGLLASLLRVEEASNRAAYPHRLFEAGDVEVRDPTTLSGLRATQRLAAMTAHPAAALPELQADLTAFLAQWGLSATVRSGSWPTFVEGRYGELWIEETRLGWIGEVHPEVLARWSIKVPASATEISLTKLWTLLRVEA